MSDIRHIIAPAPSNRFILGVLEEVERNPEATRLIFYDEQSQTLVAVTCHEGSAIQWILARPMSEHDADTAGGQIIDRFNADAAARQLGSGTA